MEKISPSWIPRFGVPKEGRDVCHTLMKNVRRISKFFFKKIKKIKPVSLTIHPPPE
jgi:hypothetical protein